MGWNKLQLGNNGFNNIVAGQHSSDSNDLDFYTDNTTHPTGSIDGKHVMRMNYDGDIFIYSGSLILEGSSSGDISGSSTSTGSFGHLKLGDKTRNDVDHLVPSADGVYENRNYKLSRLEKKYMVEVDLANSQFIQKLNFRSYIGSITMDLDLIIKSYLK